MPLVLILIWSFVILWCVFLYYFEVHKKIDKLPILSVRNISKQFSAVTGNPSICYKLILNLRFTYKRFFGLWTWPYFNIFIYDPRDVQAILKTSRQTKKSSLMRKLLSPWLGDSILLSSGEKFDRNKKIIMKAFHYDRLKQYIPIFEKNAQDLAKDIQGFVGSKEEFNVYQYVSKCMWLSIWETAFGIDKDFLERDAIPYIQAMERVSQCIAKRSLNFRYYPDFLFKFTETKKTQDECIKILNSITSRALNKKQKDFEKNRLLKESNDLNSEKTKLFVDYFFEGIYEKGQSISEKEIMDEISTLMLGGHETGTLLICYILCILGTNFQVQERVYQEIASVLEPSGEIKYESLGRLKYMEQIIYETVRLFPSIPLILRSNTQDITLYDGTIIPKNSSIIILILLLHRNPEEFPNPDEFNPDNFAPENIKSRHPYSFIPFSVGYRACVGSKYAMLIMKVILVTLLRNFKFASRTSMEDYQFLPQVGLKRSDGFNISIENR